MLAKPPTSQHNIINCLTTTASCPPPLSNVASHVSSAGSFNSSFRVERQISKQENRVLKRDRLETLHQLSTSPLARGVFLLGSGPGGNGHQTGSQDSRVGSSQPSSSTSPRAHRARWKATCKNPPSPGRRMGRWSRQCVLEPRELPGFISRARDWPVRAAEAPDSAAAQAEPALPRSVH